MQPMEGFPTESFRRTIIEMGADLAGFADLREIPDDIRNGLPRGISIAKKYAPEVIAGIHNGPTPEYAAMYERLNAELNSVAKRIAAYIEGLGFNAKVRLSTVAGPSKGNRVVEFKPLEEIAVRLPHKTVATLAGLGWIGRTDLLVTKKYGPRIRLASILTDAPFECDKPIVESRCGKCVACVDACPVDAGRTANWRRDLLEEKYDVYKCYEFAKKISLERGFNHHLCGICIAACPVGKIRDGATFS